MITKMAIIIFIFMLFAMMMQFCGVMANVMKECEKMHKIRNEVVYTDYESAMHTTLAGALIKNMMQVDHGL